MSNKNTQTLMEKIALLLQEEKGSDDSTFLRESLTKINQRLDKIESQITSHNLQPQTPNPKFQHPSLEKMRIIEEVVEELFSSQQTQKLCTFEPHNKPCDNCSLCNTRGF
ncbi:MAG: hypothetical protein AAB336_05665 [Acidobacteriota bacterium]